MGKTSISVPEMQRLLGMKKVEAYWLVKQGRFKVILVGRQNAGSCWTALRNGTAVNSATKRSTAGTRTTTPCVSDRPGDGWHPRAEPWLHL